jgi:pteridine reductase
LKNKTVLITGAAKRIGATIAEQLHETGMNIIIHYNKSDKDALALTDKLNNIRAKSAITIQADLEQQDAYSYLIDSALSFNGKLDVLVNNASTFFPTPMSDTNEKQWHELINVNLKAPLFLSKLAASSLKENNGCIINIADIHAYKPLTNHTIYSVSKAGLIMLTQSLAKELAPDVRVNAISPGAITWHDSIDERSKELILENTALKRTGEMHDISDAVLFLINDADYITGQILNVDGGRTLY